MVPKLRFSQFHSPWCTKTLGEVGEIISGLTYSPENIRNSGLLVLRSSNIQSGRLCFEDCVYVDLIVDDEKKTRKNDILICVRNGSRSLIGKNTLIKEIDQETTHGAFMTVFRGPLNGYVAQLLQTKKFYSQVYSDLGATINSINGGNLKRYSFSFPSDFNETAKIADFLSYIDEKIMLLNKQYDLLCQYKKGMMQKIFSQEVRFKDENGKDFPQWRLKKIREITSLIKDGTHGTHNNVTESDFLLLSAKNIQEGKVVVDSKDRKISEIEFRAITKNYKLAPGDILLSVVGTIGRVAIYSEQYANYAFQRSVAFFRFPQEQPEFIYQLFNSTKFQKELIIRQVISAQPGIYLGDLADISLEIPVQKEQMKIANFLSALDDKIAAKKAELDKLKTWKQGLSQQMFV